jgi:hypothetical protein
MYLIDDVVTYTPQDDHKIDQSIEEHTYCCEGIIRDILETEHGSMYYDVEVSVPGPFTGSDLLGSVQVVLSSVPESDLAYAGMHVSAK